MRPWQHLRRNYARQIQALRDTPYGGKAAAMRWEYTWRTINIINPVVFERTDREQIADGLNALGAEGWEAVQLERGTEVQNDRVHVLLKRKVAGCQR